MRLVVSGKEAVANSTSRIFYIYRGVRDSLMMAIQEMCCIFGSGVQQMALIQGHSTIPTYRYPDCIDLE